VSNLGTLSWSYTTPTAVSGITYDNFASPIVGANSIIYFNWNGVYALTSSGTLKWYSNTGIVGPCAMAADGIIYTHGSDSIVAVGTLLSTMSPLVAAYNGLQLGAISPKFKGDLANTVSQI
jgi:hypothetical protein